jgi:hypothetical protein
VDRLHELVDWRHSRSTMDHRQSIGRSSSECGLTSAARLGSLPQLHREGRRMKGSSPRAALDGGVTELGRQR